MQTGLIFDIKKYAINDGPGIRTTVFLKGCPLQCAWCHNPESISPQIQKMYNPDKCMGCKGCIEVCPEKACSLTSEGVVVDRQLCKSCGECAEICPTKATEMSGRPVTVAEIVEIVEKERVFFDQSGGGVTFSGGEPLQQADFLIDLLDEFGRRGIHRTVDTSGFSKSETLLEVAKRTDLFLYDLKVMDSKKHKKWTGVENEQILRNLQLLAETGVSISIRIPLIKGVNDCDKNIEETASFVAALPGEKRKVHILPYHNIAANKYRRLGQQFDDSELVEPGEKRQAEVIATFASHGLQVITGG